MKCCITAKRQRIKQVVICLMCVVIVVAAVCLVKAKRERAQAFVKPEFEQNVKQINEVQIDDKSYSVLKVADEYLVGLCGLPKQVGQDLNICFTNPEENEVWLQLSVYDENDELIAESGLIKPGEILSKIPLQREMNELEKVKIHIAGYEPDTYYSLGEMSFETKISE